MVMSSDNISREVLVFQPEKGLTASLHEFTNTAYEKALLVIKERMPKKIVSLTKLLNEKSGYASFFAAEGNAEKRAKVAALPAGEVTAAFKLAESEFHLLKEEVLELVEMASAVKLWLQLNVPRIEDGNNFGVSIQSDTVAELARVEDAALMTVENWSKFLMLRAKTVGKMHKHEHASGHAAIEASYRLTLEALDEKQLRSVWIGWLDLRNNYAVIWDLIIKNIEKLVNPRSTNTSNMY